MHNEHKEEVRRASRANNQLGVLPAIFVPFVSPFLFSPSDSEY
jgi:hypothetical protein